MTRPIPGNLANRETVIAVAAEAAVLSARSRVPFDDALRQTLYEEIEQVLLLGIPMSAVQEAEIEAQEPQELAPYNPWLDEDRITHTDDGRFLLLQKTA